METNRQINTLTILLADDDADDRFFFNKALGKVQIPTVLKIVEDGEFLMEYLLDHSAALPDVLFLDINMPRKNGMQCIAAMKADERLRHLPVVIYSTAVPEAVTDIIYKMGADFYVRKSDLYELEKNIHYVLSLLAGAEFTRAGRKEFVINMTKAT